MSGWTTAVDTALTALLTAFRNSADLANVSISDGPMSVDTGTSQLLTVGNQADSTDDLAVEVQTSQEGWANGPQRELFDVRCSASAYVGDDDQSLARAAVFPIYRAACTAIYADPTLGGAVLRAVPGAWSLHQSAATDQGRIATVNFAISVDAFTA